MDGWEKRIHSEAAIREAKKKTIGAAYNHPGHGFSGHIPPDFHRDPDIILSDAVDELMDARQHTIRGTQKRIGEWSRATFPASTSKTTALHLKEEVAELLAAQSWQECIDEAADVFILLSQFCERAGIDLQGAVEEKHRRNQQRIWLAPDAQGVVRHNPEGGN